MVIDQGAAGAGNPVFGIERRGIEHIPEDARGTTLRDLANFWIGSSLYPFNFLIGVLAYSVGLSLGATLLTLILGTVAGYVLVGYGGAAGARSGISTHVVARSAFGVIFQRVNALLAWVVGVIYEIINNVTGVFAALALFDYLGWSDSGNAGKIVGLIGVYVASVLLSFLGHGTVIFVARFFSVALGIVGVLVLISLLPDLDLGVRVDSGLSGGVAFLIAMGIVYAGSVSYSIVAADYSRYMPSVTSSSAIAWTTALSASVATLLLAFGGAIGASQGDLDAFLADPIAAMDGVIPGWLFLLFALAAIGGSVSNNALTLYSASLAAQAVGLPLKRVQAVGVDAVFAIAGILWVLFRDDSALKSLNDAVVFGVAWTAPFGAIWVYDVIRRRYFVDAEAAAGHKGNPYGDVNPGGALGIIAGVVVAILSISVPRFTGPIAKAFDGADLSWLFGTIVALVVYRVLNGRLRQPPADG